MTMSGAADLAPIAVFAYNRPDKLKTMLSSLKRCHGFADSLVTIFVDGPKPGQPDEMVRAVREIVRGIDLPNVEWQFAETNRGLRQAIHSGVGHIIRTHGRAIVLEDDLVLSSSALIYFNSALEAYQHEERVWSIAGYAYDAPSLRNNAEALILPFAHPWGWATWSRSWSKFELDNQPSPEQLGAKSFQNAFDMNGLYPFTSLLQSSIAGRVNSWFIHWYYTIFQNSGVSIFPPRRFVDNFGFSNGSHGGSLNPYDCLVKRPSLLEKLPALGNATDVDFAALDQLKSCHELRVQRFIARAGSAKRRLLAGR